MIFIMHFKKTVLLLGGEVNSSLYLTLSSSLHYMNIYNINENIIDFWALSLLFSHLLSLAHSNAAVLGMPADGLLPYAFQFFLD